MESKTLGGLGLGAPLCSAILRLTLKRKWFDMIASGEKREEYRTPKRWILSRLEGKDYGSVEFSNGYGKGVPVVTLEYLGWSYGTGRREWGGTGYKVAVIHMGRILSKQNAESSNGEKEARP